MSSTGHLSELDLLRSQVADLSRELAERDCVTQDLREQSDLLRAIVEGTAAETGEEFFASLVTHLTAALHIQFAVIGEVQGDRIKKMRTLAVSAGGVLVDNFEYDLPHTPCATALTQAFTCFNQDLQATFPGFQRLVDLGAESYCAVPIRTKDGEVRGLLVVMDTKPLQHGEDLQSLLEVFAPRAGAEFERRRVEQEHARALAEIHNVIKTIPDIMFTLDTHGNMVNWNRRVEDVTGYSPEELLNMPALAFVPPEEHIPCATAIERAFTEGYAEFEGHLVTKDHRLIPYHWTGALLKNSYGEPIGITGIGRDVSGKKRVEEALRKSEHRFALAVEGSSDILWDATRLSGEPWYAPQTQIWWSPRVRELLGLQESDSFETFEQWVARLHPDDKDRVFGQLAAHIEHRVPYDVEYRLRTNAGDYRWIRGRGQALWDEQGEPSRMSGSCQDITERKEVEEALRASEERWQLAVRGSNDGIWDWDIPSGTVFFSPRWKAMRGFGEYEITSHVEKWQSRIHPDDLDRVLQNLNAYMSKQTPVFCEEYRTQRKDGSYMWILDRGLALWAEGGTPVRMVGSESDITEHKLALLRLAEQESLLRAIHDTDPECVSRVADDGTILQMNRAGLCFIESDSFEQVAGRSVFDLVAHEFLERYRRMHEAVILGASQRLEFQIVGLKGTRRWMETHAVPLRNPIDHRMEHLAVTRDITDRKQAEEALRASEERLRLSLEAANQGIYDLNVQTGEALVSPGYVTMLDYDPATFRETNAAWIERLHPDDRDRVADYYRAYVAGEIPEYRVEFRQRTRGGDWRWILSLGRIVECDARGEPLRMLGTHTDITERKQTEEALRASEDRFNLAVRGSNTGIWDWDLRTGKTYFSPLWKSMLGYEEHELRGELFEWEERLHPDDRKRSSATVRAYLEGATAQYELEHRLRHKDGSYRWIMARGVSICDTEGKPYRMAGSHIDITEQKQTQEALAQRERQLQTVLDALPVGVWFTDRAGRVLLANPAAKQIWSNIKQIGLQTENPQTGWWESIGPVNEPHRWALSHVLTTGVPSQDETFDFECFDGTKKTIRNSTVPVKNEAGVTLGAILLNEDITMLRQAQAALQLTQFSVDHALEGFLWIGPDARIFHVNDSICRMLEYSWEELTTMTQYDIDPNLSSEAWPAHWEKLKEKGSLTFESKYWSRTGRVLDMEVTVNYLQYEGKEYNCAIMRDIGERKRVQAALRVSEERYRSLYDETPTMYFTLTMDGMVLSVNRFGAEQLGYQAEELIGHSVLGLFYEDDQEIVAASLSECLATPEITRHWEFRKLRKDGSMLWVRETTRVGQSSTEGTTVQVTCEDITERKRAEEALHRREHDLHVAIEERERISQDLHDGILQSLFAVGLSLETTKSMMSPRTRKTSGPALDQAIQQLNLVMHEIRNFIAGLASDLLQGKDLTMALKQMLASLTENQSTNVRLAVDDRAAKALSTEQSLHLVRVIQEAVSNCIQHGNASEARVSLKLLKKGVRLSVRDNGCGFIQTSAQRTGHGLRNMASRAQKIGGKFSILSKVNEGTSIVLDLPKGATDAFR